MKRNLAAACLAASTLFALSPSFAQTGGDANSGMNGRTYSENRDGNNHWGWLGLLGLAGLAGLRRKQVDDRGTMGRRPA